MYKFFIGFVLVMSGCASTHHVETEKISNDTVKKLKSRWKIPSKIDCESHGGVFMEKRKLCEATYSDAVKICQNLGAKVPSLDEYIQMAYTCGATEKSIAHYNYRDRYRLCLKELHIHPVKPSWTSNTERFDNTMQTYFSPLKLNKQNVGYFSKKEVGHFVTCIK